MGLDLLEKTTAGTAESWHDRAQGEQHLGRFLDDVFADTGVVLHDRLVADGSKRCTIDHIVVTSSGVWVIDAYNDNHLLIGWSQQKTHVDGTGWQTAAVRELLDSEGLDAVPVHRVLCFCHSDWARRPNAAVVDGVLVLSPDKLGSVASQPGQVENIDAIAALLDSPLHVASHR